MNNKIKIEFDIDSLLILWCQNFECKFNEVHLLSKNAAHCNLKNIELDENGKCRNQEKKEK
jgi:hypothetical protein